LVTNEDRSQKVPSTFGTPPRVEGICVFEDSNFAR